MPNWCYNQTIFYGNKEETQKLYEGLKDVVDYRTNDHIDNFFKLLGVPQELLNNEYFIRAHICNFQLLTDGSLELSYESAWNPIIEDLNAILKEYKPNLKQVTYAEECGCGIYINTDRNGLYFTDKYYLDCSNEDCSEYNDIKNHDCLESVIEEFKRFYNIDTEITTEEELKEEIEKVREKYDYECYITFEEFTDY